MELKRRDFLKGLMALAGVAAVGLPPAEDSELIADVEQFLASGGEPARPTGPFGSIRIGDKWYALHDASVGVNRGLVDAGQVDGWGVYTAGHASWNIDCELDNMDGISIYDPLSYPIEVNIQGRTFSGNAYLISGSSNVGPNGNVRYSLDFEGAGPLSYA